MCLAVPAKVLQIKDEYAECDFGGVTREVNTGLLDTVEVGDYVVVHVGYAIGKMSAEEAMDVYGIWNKLLDTGGPGRK